MCPYNWRRLCESLYQAEDSRVGLSKTMANRSRSGPAHLERPSILEEFVHVDQHMRSEVHKETQRQPSAPLQCEGLTTNMEGVSYANRDVEVERLREQVTLLQRNVEKDKELLRHKDKELHH